MKKIIKAFLVGACGSLFLFSLGCASSSLDVNIPMNRFQTPTTSGGLWKGKAGYFTSGGVTVKVVNDMTQTPPSSSGTQITSLQTSSGGFDLALGLAEMVDIVSVYGGVGAKVQFLGIGKHDWVGTLRAVQASSTSSNSLTVGGNAYSGSASLTARDYGVSVGRYLNENLIGFGSLGYRDLKGNSNIQQPGQAYNYSDSGLQRIASVGLEVQVSYFDLAVEAGGGTTTWSRASDSWMNFIGIEGAFRW